MESALGRQIRAILTSVVVWLTEEKFQRFPNCCSHFGPLYLHYPRIMLTRMKWLDMEALMLVNRKEAIR